MSNGVVAEELQGQIESEKVWWYNGPSAGLGPGEKSVWWREALEAGDKMTSDSSGQVNQTTETETTDSGWQTLYKVGGTAALITAVFIPIQIAIFIVSPPPASVIDWFMLFQRSPLLGLLDMDLLLVVDNVLAIPIFLAFYVALRRVSKSIMTIAMGLAFRGL